MNCQTARRHLHPFLDDELELDQNLAVLEHVNACSACRAYFEREHRMHERWRSALETEAAPAAIRSTLASLDRRGPRRLLPRVSAQRLVATAAGLVLTLVIGAEFLHRGNPTPSGPVLDEPEAEAPKIPQAGPPTHKVADGPRRELPPAVDLSQMMLELLGTQPEVPNALSMDGGPPLSGLVPYLDEVPLLQEWLRGIEDRSFVVFRVEPKYLPFINLELASVIDLGADAKILVKKCCDQRVLLVKRGPEAFLVASSASKPLLQLLELLERTR